MAQFSATESKWLPVSTYEASYGPRTDLKALDRISEKFARMILVLSLQCRGVSSLGD